MDNGPVLFEVCKFITGISYILPVVPYQSCSALSCCMCWQGPWHQVMAADEGSHQRSP